MPLNATQRDFLVNQLGIQARKRTVPDRKTKDEHVDEGLSTKLAAYISSEAEALAVLNKIQALKGTTVLATPLEAELAEVQKDVGAIKRTTGDRSWERVDTKLAALKPKLQAALKTAQDNLAYFTALDKLEKDYAALDKHKQKAHVSGEFGTATTELTAAREAEKIGNFVAANAAVVKAQAAVDLGKGFADKYAAYLPFKADAGRIVGAMKGVYSNASVWDAFNNKMTAANTAVDPPTRKYAESEIKLKEVVAGLKADVVRFYVTNAKPKIATLQATVAGLESSPVVKAGGSVVQPALDEINKLQTQVEADIAASKWGQALMGARTKVANLISVGLKTAARRKAYDTNRAATMAKIEALKSHKSLLGQIFSLNKLVERADGLASAESLRMEDGSAELTQIDATCAQLAAVAADAEKYLEERVEADKEAQALQKLPGIGRLQEQIDNIDALLAQAQKTTGIVDAESAIVAGKGMEDHHAFQQDWAGALKQVLQARVLIKAASDAAAALGDTVKSLDAAGGAKNAEQITLAATALRQQTEAAKLRAHADQATAEFGKVLPLLDKALQQASAEGGVDAAAASLREAGELLLTARTVQAEHGRLLAVHAALAERVRLLTISTEPAALSLKGKTDPLLVQLQGALDASKARKWHDADLALVQAATAVTEAELIQRLRKEFDIRAKRVEQERVALTDNPLKVAVAEITAKALAQADAFNLDHASRFLDNAEARIAGASLATLAASNPGGAAFMAAVEKMLLAKGGEELLAKPSDNAHTQSGKARKIPDGPELLDAIIKGLPDTVAPKVIALIALKRFGIDLRVSGLEDDGTKVVEKVGDNPTTEDETALDAYPELAQRTKSGRKMYEMLALTPEQAKDNPSMKRVERRDALKKNASGGLTSNPSSGGFYQGSGDLVVMSGRPGDITQKFGANLKNSGGLDQLGTIDKGCEPANEDPIDYFDFAVVHEVGHAVDDRVNFMGSREGQAAFGGWVTYGGNVSAIVKAVGKHAGYNSTDEQAEYISDVILGATPEPPVAPEGEAVAWEAARLKVHAWYAIATNEKLWWNQAQSMSIAIDGVIYQRAYAGTWVSYLAAARAKGITGYQFRAPGEWFAELYACYHMGKLKPGHPARAWLSSLSL